MKKNLVSSYISGIMDTDRGESYTNIIRYIIPEFISAVILYSLPIVLDSFFISQIDMVSYATLGAANNFIHIIIKMAEGLSVGTVILAGQFNGQNEFQKVGQTLRDSFWITCITGLAFGLFLYFGAYWIYWWYGVPEELIPGGIPYLELRSLNVLFLFIFMAFVGFLRGIKQVRVPMLLFIFGAIVFVFSDYLLIFGGYGFPALGLNGSAIASIIQYGVMLLGASGYFIFNKQMRKYSFDLLSGFTEPNYVPRLIMLSLPVVLDKSIFAIAYVWLCKMVCPMGASAIASFNIVKDMQRFAFLPAAACAQVITFIASNYRGRSDWEGIKSSIKKVAFLASICVFGLLAIFCIFPQHIITFFDKKNEFAPLAARAFPLISVLVFFDLIQLVLSGALRGTGNVRIVMLVRFFSCAFFFVPASWLVAHAPIESVFIKFVLIFATFYLSNGIMAVTYIYRLRGESWKKPPVSKG